MYEAFASGQCMIHTTRAEVVSYGFSVASSQVCTCLYNVFIPDLFVALTYRIMLVLQLEEGEDTLHSRFGVNREAKQGCSNCVSRCVELFLMYSHQLFIHIFTSLSVCGYVEEGRLTLKM